MTLKIATRLWLPSLVVTAVLVFAGATVAVRTTAQIAHADTVLRDSESKLLDAAIWRGLTQANAVRVLASLASSDPALGATMKPEIAATTATISEIQQRIDAAARDPSERAVLDRIAQARKDYIAVREAAVGKAGGAAQVQPAVAAYLAAQQVLGLWP